MSRTRVKSMNVLKTLFKHNNLNDKTHLFGSIELGILWL